MRRNLLLSAVVILLGACSAQNNVSFNTQVGSCADGTNNAPYCMAVTIQNNNGGQNWINNTNYPIKSLTFNYSGPSNISYPSSSGSKLDPNNCLGTTINPGGKCTFYLWIQGESLPVNQSLNINLTANYTVKDTLFGSSSTSKSASFNVTEVANLLISGANGYVESYNLNNFAGSYQAESSETYAQSYANDNYYGFLYLGGNSGIYASGNGNYAFNLTNSSAPFTGGATNLLVSGTNIYTQPTGSLSNTLYSSGLAAESYSWSQYATGLASNLEPNIAAVNSGGNWLFMSSNSQVYSCGSIAGSSSNTCQPEATTLTGTVNALATTTLGNTADGIALTGLIVATNKGVFAESGTSFGYSTNGWLPIYSSTNPTESLPQIVSMTSDSSGNIYLADISNHLYQISPSQGNLAQLLTWNFINSSPVAAMTYDNAGQALFIITQDSKLYQCTNANGCIGLGTSSISHPIGLSVISSLND